MQTTFDCPCGARVTSAEGSKGPPSADMVAACETCGREFSLTLSSGGDGTADPDRAERSDQRPGAEGAPGTGETSPLEVGETAPDFELPGAGEDGIDTFRLSEYTETGPVLLSFYPFDFSSICTEQLCRFRDMEWVQVAEDTDVFAVSGDSVYSHRAFRRENEFQFPLLTDRLAHVAGSFGVRYGELKRHPAVCQRAMFGIDADRRIGYRWQADHPAEEPDFDDLGDALDWAD